MFNWSNFYGSIFTCLTYGLYLGICAIFGKSGTFLRASHNRIPDTIFGVFLGVVAVIAFTPHASSLGKVGIKSIFLLVLAGILAGFVAQIVFYKALKAGEISRIIPIASCSPLFTFF